MIRWTEFETPFGNTFAAATSKGVLRLSWGVEDASVRAEELRASFPLWGVEQDGERLRDLRKELHEYFGGKRRGFGVSVDLTGLTVFQEEVLDETARLGFGETISYGELARRIGRPRSGRAVGAALGKNPVPILVPCHRVVRSDGKLGGYTSGCGYKRQLLEMEGRE